MAKQVVLICDHGDGECGKPATSYRLWRDGDRQAATVDLCDEHAAPLLLLMDAAPLVDLPVKPRQRMELTRLQTTPKTAPLKKKP